MDQIALITLWMVATQIGHAFADQMYGYVDRENVKRLRKCQCNGHERERRRAGSAAPITESLTVKCLQAAAIDANRQPQIRCFPGPVSYTHLTLPTNREV